MNVKSPLLEKKKITVIERSSHGEKSSLSTMSFSLVTLETSDAALYPWKYRPELVWTGPECLQPKCGIVTKYLKSSSSFFPKPMETLPLSLFRALQEFKYKFSSWPGMLTLEVHEFRKQYVGKLSQWGYLIVLKAEARIVWKCNFEIRLIWTSILVKLKVNLTN